MRKFIRFNSAVKAPTTDTDFEFIITYDKPVYIQRKISGEYVGWTRKSPLIDYQGDMVVKFTGSTSTNDMTKMRGMGMKPFKIWDSGKGDSKKSRLVKVTWIPVLTASGNQFRFIKTVPADFFANSTFPVFTDTTSVFYPNPDPETTTVDGVVNDRINNLTWANLIIEAGNYAGPSDAGDAINMCGTSDTTNQWNNLYRFIALFDTSNIPDTNDVTAATFSLYGGIYAKADDAGIAPNVNIYASTPATNTNLVAGDFTKVASTSFSDVITYANWNDAGYNNFALNATGLAAVSKTSVTKLGARNASYDVAATPPAWNVGGKNSYVSCYFADQAGTSTDPMLSVTYSTAAGGATPPQMEVILIE